jgi:hypothetical protein
MNISPESVQTIINNVKSWQCSFIRFTDEQIRNEVIDYLNNSFNNKWNNGGLKDKAGFEKFCIFIASHQCNHRIHPLTCGVDSNHALLMPRQNYDGKNYLVCPTCGYIQFSLMGQNL